MIDGTTDEFELVADLADQLGASADRATTAARLTIEVEGARLSGIRWGNPDGPVTEVYLHSGGQNAHAWDRVLLGRQTNAIAFDLPGHGYSSWLEPPTYLPRQMAPIVHAGIQRLAPQMRLLAGASLGGLTAIRLMSLHPDLAAHLVLVDVTPGSTPDRATGTTEFMDGFDLFESFEAMVEHTRTFRPTVSPRSLRRSLSHQAKQMPDGQWSWRPDRRDPKGARRADIVFADISTYWDDVANLKGPTMLIVAGASPIITPPDLQEFIRLAPQTRIVDLPGVGHAVHTQVPNELRRLIDDFVTDTGSIHDPTFPTVRRE